MSKANTFLPSVVSNISRTCRTAWPQSAVSRPKPRDSISSYVLPGPSAVTVTWALEFIEHRAAHTKHIMPSVSARRRLMFLSIGSPLFNLLMDWLDGRSHCPDYICCPCPSLCANCVFLVASRRRKCAFHAKTG